MIPVGGMVRRMGRGIATSRRQVGEHAAYWARLSSAGALIYVALGDSAAQGVGVDDPRQGYVGVLHARLERTTRQQISLVNLSVSGATTATLIRDQLSRLTTLPTPAFITCVIGSNDVALGRPFRSSAFRAAAEVLVQSLPDHAVLGTVPSFGHWPYERWAKRANAALFRAGTARGLRIADLHAPTRGLWPWRYTHILAGDFFHPNARGYRLWADALWPHLHDTVLPR